MGWRSLPCQEIYCDIHFEYLTGSDSQNEESITNPLVQKAISGNYFYVMLSHLEAEVLFQVIIEVDICKYVFSVDSPVPEITLQWIFIRIDNSIYHSIMTKFKSVALALEMDVAMMLGEKI